LPRRSGHRIFLLTLIAALIVPVAQSQSADPRKEARLSWWREARFGMFIHWGLYALPAGEWKGKQYSGIGEWIMYKARIPIAEYEELARQFNPVKFDAEADLNSIVIFSPDYSFDLRLLGGRRSQLLLPTTGETDNSVQHRLPNIRVGTGHTGEEVLVSAKGPSAERVHGFIPNTELFNIMMAAFGWSNEE
jgi:hypothetical protein